MSFHTFPVEEVADMPIVPTRVQIMTADNPTAPGVFLAGGWDLDLNRLQGVQEAFEAIGISTVAASVFDTVARHDPITPDHPAIAELADRFPDQPPRMLLRGVILHNMVRFVLHQEIEDNNITRTVAHCGGAPVVVEAGMLHYYRHGQQGSPLSQGVLAEPMIAQDMTLQDYSRTAARHEIAAKKERPDFISLRELASAEADQRIQTNRVYDIMDNHGIRRLMRAMVWFGGNYHVILGDEDAVAPKKLTESQLSDSGFAGEIAYYSNQEKFGHGYLLVEPQKAVADIAQLLVRTP
jgi:hypothetical protein